MFTARATVACVFAVTLSGCGLLVPEKDILHSDYPDNPQGISDEAKYEDMIVRHLACEIASGIWEATENPYFNASWLKSHKWGTAVTLTITAEDQSALNPGVSFTNPLPSTQSFTLGLGASGSANTTRTETIQFTYINDDLWAFARLNAKSNGGHVPCDSYQKGLMVDSDLKIAQFINDKVAIGSLGNGSSAYRGWYPFNTFTENLSFVASFGGNVTPTWKLTKFAANSSGTFLSATRTKTNQLTITIGPIGTYASEYGPTQLSSAAQAQHNTQTSAGAISTAITNQSAGH
jgi:hypothetical protein